MSILLTVISLDSDSPATPIKKVYNKKEISLGRLPGNDLVLDKPEVSGYHARLRATEDPIRATLMVKDLGSSNGTIVENNSIPAQIEVEVMPNQQIIIGKFLITPSVINESTSSPKFFCPVDTQIDTPAYQPDDEIGDSADTIVMESDLAAPNDSDEPVAVKQTGRLGIRDSDGVTIEVSGAHVELNFSATALFTVEGVLQHNGVPLAEVEIEACELGSCITDADGHYRFSGVPDGSTLALKVKKRGFSFDFSESLEKVSGNTHLDIAAVELCSLSGRIEHRGEPLVGVLVDGGELGERETDINGEFCFADVRDGSGYTIRVSKEGYFFDTQTFSGNVSTNMPLLKTAARKLFTISGIVSHKGQPLVGVIVDGGDVLGTTTTDENGRYIFENVPEDVSYTIVASKDDFTFLAEK